MAEQESQTPSNDGVDGVDTSPNSPPDLDAQLQFVQAELVELQGQMHEQQLRNLAELENVRKRAEREVNNSARYGAERLLRDLLAIADSLELGLKAATASEASAQSIAEGLALTHRQLIDVLEKHGVVVVDPQGEAFNHDWHEAVAGVPSDAVAPNHVIEVMQKGYRLHERLLRPARVVVAKPADQAH